MSLRIETCHNWRDVHRNFSFHLINMASTKIFWSWKHQYITIWTIYKRIYQYASFLLLKGYKTITLVERLFLFNKTNKTGTMNLKLRAIC